MASELYTKAKILERLLLDLPEYWDKSTGSIFNDEMASIAIEFENAYSKITSEFQRGRIAYATGEDLDLLLSDYGFYRKGKTKASGDVIFTGKPGAAINFGALVSNGVYTYSTTESAVVGEDGTVTVSVECTIYGENGNTNIDTIKIIPISIADIYSVNNDEAIRGGSDDETDSQFRQRFYDQYKNLAASGNPAEYEKWAMEVDGVGYAKCIPIWNGPGTVKVVISDLNNRPVTDLCDVVYQHIASKYPIGADLTVESVAEIRVTVYIEGLEIDASFSEDNVKQDIIKNIEEYFCGLSMLGDTISYFNITKCIMMSSGVINCTDIYFEINGESYKVNYQLPEYTVATIAELEVYND